MIRIEFKKVRVPKLKIGDAIKVEQRDPIGRRYHESGIVSKIEPSRIILDMGTVVTVSDLNYLGLDIFRATPVIDEKELNEAINMAFSTNCSLVAIRENNRYNMESCAVTEKYFARAVKETINKLIGA